MKMTDDRVRQAVAHRLSALDDGPSRRFLIARRIEREEKQRMKKKQFGGLVLVMLLLLALTGVALGLTTNLFDFFGKRDARYEKVAERAGLATSAPVAVSDDALGTVRAEFDSAFYDGRTLNAAIVIDGYVRVAPWSPDAETLSSMEALSALPLMAIPAEQTEKAEAQRAMQAACAAKTPYGYRVIEYFPADHVRTDDGVDIPPYTADPTVDGEGRYVEMREFTSPLPEALRDLPAITLNCVLCRQEQLWYFDGQALYYKQRNEAAGMIRAVVPRSDGMTRRMQGQSRINEGEYSATAQVSVLSAVLTLEGAPGASLGTLLGDTAKMPEGIDPSDVWVSIACRDEQGRAYRVESGFSLDQALPVTAVFLGVGELPEALDIQIYLEWEGEGETQSPPMAMRLLPDAQ